MAKSKRLPEVFDLARVLRDSYRQQYDKAVTERDNAIKYAKQNYITKSPLLKQALETARNEFAQKVENLKTETRKALTEEIENLKAIETAKVLTTPMGIERYKALESVPVTRMELSIIAQQQGGKDYHLDKFLRVIGDRNGIDMTDPDKFPLMTAIDDKIEALESLSDDLENLLSSYDETQSLKGFSALSDRVITQAENKFIGAERTMRTMKQKTNMAYQQIASQPTQLDKANAIGNALRNCTDKASRDALLVKLAESPVGDLAESMSAGKMIQAFRDGKARAYHEAETALASLTEAGRASDWDTVAEILTANKDSEFFPDMAVDVLKSSDKASETAQKVNADIGETVYDVY